MVSLNSSKTFTVKELRAIALDPLQINYEGRLRKVLLTNWMQARKHKFAYLFFTFAGKLYRLILRLDIEHGVARYSPRHWHDESVVVCDEADYYNLEHYSTDARFIFKDLKELKNVEQ